MARIAHRLGRLARPGNPQGHGGALPSLWLFTDPVRLPDPLAAAAALPPGSGVVLRTFGRPDVEALAPALAALARRRGLVLLVGEDARLAARIGAHGVHLPQRKLPDLARLRARHPRWRLSVAAHGMAALHRAERAGADAAFLSSAFASASPSAGAPVGPTRMASMARHVALPVYALGGVTAMTARRLVDVGVAGIAAVEALRT